MKALATLKPWTLTPVSPSESCWPVCCPVPYIRYNDLSSTRCYKNAPSPDRSRSAAGRTFAPFVILARTPVSRWDTRHKCITSSSCCGWGHISKFTLCLQQINTTNQEAAVHLWRSARRWHWAGGRVRVWDRGLPTLASSPHAVRKDTLQFIASKKSFIIGVHTFSQSLTWDQEMVFGPLLICDLVLCFSSFFFSMLMSFFLWVLNPLLI